jgi:hypothetical protein
LPPLELELELDDDDDEDDDDDDEDDDDEDDDDDDDDDDELYLFQKVLVVDKEKVKFSKFPNILYKKTTNKIPRRRRRR